MAEGLEALLRSAQATLSAASATLPSAEERRAEAAAAESLAASGAGAVAKTAVGVAGRLRRQSKDAAQPTSNVAATRLATRASRAHRTQLTASAEKTENRRRMCPARPGCELDQFILPE
jgi:hypothetical protein